MSFKERISCEKLSNEEIQNIIKSYIDLGWEFEGILDGFPPNMRWLHFSWNKEEPPIRPGKEHNN